jgi:hypothetical protein
MPCDQKGLGAPQLRALGHLCNLPASQLLNCKMGVMAATPEGHSGLGGGLNELFL